MRKKRAIKIILIILACLLVAGAAAVIGINAHVKRVGGRRMLTAEKAAELEGVDCIIVLGCLVRSDGTPSDMLADRLRRGIELYEAGAAPKILMSGDHGRTSYDEVNTMKQVAIDAGVPSGNVFMDHAGFSTYETLYRARDIFKADKVVIVTQSYHLYRALYIAEQLGIEAYGVDADYRTYWGQAKRDVREMLARCKDLVTTWFMPEPTYLGDAIPVSGNGDLTND